MKRVAELDEAARLLRAVRRHRPAIESAVVRPHADWPAVTLAALTLLVVAIGTADALAADVVERTRELGTLRTLGLSPQDVALMLVMQALAIGIVGAVLGLLVGAGLSLSFVEGLLPDILGWQIGLRFNPFVALWVSMAE